MAAEAARAAGVGVDLYEGLGSVGRKFLLAGKGGLNLTHAEPPDRFVQRYANLLDEMVAGVEAFGADVRERHYPSPDHGYTIPDEEFAAFRADLAERLG